MNAEGLESSLLVAALAKLDCWEKQKAHTKTKVEAVVSNFLLNNQEFPALMLCYFCQSRSSDLFTQTVNTEECVKNWQSKCFWNVLPLLATCTSSLRSLSQWKRKTRYAYFNKRLQIKWYFCFWCYYKDTACCYKVKTSVRAWSNTPEQGKNKVKSHLHVVFCDLYLGCVDVINQLPQSLTVHFSDLHLMGFALTHVTCTQTHSTERRSTKCTSNATEQHCMSTCEHGTEVGAAGCQDHPVSWHFDTPRHQLDVT